MASVGSKTAVGRLRPAFGTVADLFRCKTGRSSCVLARLSAGFQLGAQAYSQIIFFEDRRAFEEFTKGNFEFGADVNAVAITAAAGGSVGTTGASAEASGGMKDARTAGKYYKGMAVFTIVKGGAMYQAVVAGQKFSYAPAA
jgi:lipid-binding SYLF domain-containing protein